MIVREPMEREIAELHARALRVADQPFADNLCSLVEQYRDLAGSVERGEWPQWPRPTEAEQQLRRIIDASVELLAALGETSDAVRARLLGVVEMQSLSRGRLDSGHALEERLQHDAGALHDAAATIRQDLPRDRNGRLSRPSDDARVGFITMLRDLFQRSGVEWVNNPDELNDYADPSLAVRAVAAAFRIEPAAASKAIRPRG